MKHRLPGSSIQQKADLYFCQLSSDFFFVRLSDWARTHVTHRHTLTPSLCRAKSSHKQWYVIYRWLLLINRSFLLEGVVGIFKCLFSLLGIDSATPNLSWLMMHLRWGRLVCLLQLKELDRELLWSCLQKASFFLLSWVLGHLHWYLIMIRQLINLLAVKQSPWCSLSSHSILFTVIQQTVQTDFSSL